MAWPGRCLPCQVWNWPEPNDGHELTSNAVFHSFFKQYFSSQMGLIVSGPYFLKPVLYNQHGIAIGVETILFSNGVLISCKHKLEACKGTDQSQ